MTAAAAAIVDTVAIAALPTTIRDMVIGIIIIIVVQVHDFMMEIQTSLFVVEYGMTDFSFFRVRVFAVFGLVSFEAYVNLPSTVQYLVTQQYNIYQDPLNLTIQSKDSLIEHWSRFESQKIPFLPMHFKTKGKN